MAKSKSAISCGTRRDFFFVDPENLTLVTDKSHPLYDPRVNDPVEERLVKNIMAHNVKVPILVRKNGELLEVVAGRQRTKAAIEANKRLDNEGLEKMLVPVIPEKGTDVEMYSIMILENELRREVDPLLKPNQALFLYKKGRTESEIANTFGVSEQTVRNWLQLQELSDTVKEAVASGELSATAAGEIAHLQRDEQDECLEEMKADGDKITVAKARAAARGESGKPVHKWRPRREVEKVIEVGAGKDDEKTRCFLEGIVWAMGGESAIAALLAIE